MKDLTVRTSIEIAANAARVWQVLTQPEFTRQYMFGSETVSDWKQGSALEWRGVHEGKAVVFVKGTVTKIEPPHVLHYTTFGPTEGYPDVPANYMTVTYDVKPKGEGVELAVTQGNFATRTDGTGEKHFEGGEAGWQDLLEQIKALAEKR